MGIPSFSSLVKEPKPRKARKSRAAKKAKTYLRIDPDSGQREYVTRDDERYDTWLTAAQYRKESKATTSGGIATRVGKEIGKELTKKLTSKTRGRAARSRLAKKVVGSVSGGAGLQALSRALPIALRLSGVAAAVGALWYLSKSADDRKAQDYVERQAANQEAFLKRPLTEAELKQYLPLWRAEYDRQMLSRRANAAPIPTLR